MSFRLFDAFLFAEPHESEVLLCKLHVESELVEAWVAVENSYTPKGMWKGTHLQSVLDGDSRFEPFRDRLHVVTLDHNYRAEFHRSTKDRVSMAARAALPGYDETPARVVYDEAPNWFAERCQREAALPVIRELGGGDGWVIATDCDEMLDASDPRRRDTLAQAFDSGAPSVCLRRQRFNFDFDNICPALRSVQGASVQYLTERGLGIDDVRKKVGGIPVGHEPFVYEYSACYGRAEIERKLATFPHLDPGRSAIEVALECNHMIVPGGMTWLDPTGWYERLPIEQTGGPAYVVEHFDRLRTAVVPDDYADARRRRYPQLFAKQ